MKRNIEEFIKNDDDLDSLLNKKELKLLTNFNNSHIYNEEVRLQIEDDYYESFKEIFEKNINEKRQKGTILSLLRSVDNLATPKIKEKIAALECIQTALEKAIERLNIFKEAIFKGDDSEVLTYILINYEVLERPTLLMMNKFDSNDKVKALKNQLIVGCLDVCDNVVSARSSEKDDRYQIYSLTVNSLEKVTSVDETIQVRYDNHLRKATSKQRTVAVKYWIGLVFLLILFFIRILTRMS
jgi:hypothetical protein